MLSPIALASLAVIAPLVLLACTNLPPAIVLSGAMVFLSLTGVLTTQEALAGFANPAVLTIAGLYVVVAGLKETGAILWISRLLMNRPSGLTSANARLLATASALSTVVNNTPIVAMFIPVAQDWANRFGIPISRVLMPLNNAVILAGLCTLIGTSTNLAVNGLYAGSDPQGGIGFFELAWVGLPLAVLGFVYALVAAPWLLPARADPVVPADAPRQYGFQLHVPLHSKLIGRTLHDAGFQALHRARVVEVSRGEQLLAANAPGLVLQSGDVLHCVGIVDAIRDLRLVPGLDLGAHGEPPRNGGPQRMLVEIVLARTSALIGMRFPEAPLDARRDMRLLAIAHAGDRVKNALDQHVFAPGDTLLVEADADFAERHRHNREFLLVSPLADSSAPAFGRAPLALAILAALIANAVFAVLPLFESVAIAAALMIATRCITTRVATQSIDYPTIVSIAASFALGAALTKSGAATHLSDWVSAFSHGDAFLSLVVVYVATALVTEVITNNAAGVLMFPIAISVAAVTGSDPRPFVIAVMVGASAGFVTPIGYQTNMMVYGPGGYRFMDFVRYGLPLSILTGIVTLTIVPRVWPL